MKRFSRFVALIAIAVCGCSAGKENLSNINYLDQKPPGITAELFAPGIISTNSYEHSAPAFSPDGTVVLWTVVDKNYRASMMEMKYEQGKWSSPHRPTFADSTADDYYPSFTPDGKKLYFSSRRQAPTGYPGTDMRIWEVERIEDHWGMPTPIDTVVSKGIEYAHSVSANGTLYFSAALGGGTNFNYQKAELKKGRFAKPELLPFNINSVEYDDGPFIAPDESFLIFESARPEGMDGSIDLYISFKNKESAWTVPINMGTKINSNFAERLAKLSPDGKYLFFGSNRNQSAENWGFDIYWIDAKVIDELRNSEPAQKIIDESLGKNIIAALYKYDTESSSRLLKQWLELHPNSIDATLIYSSILRKQNRYSDAEKLLESKASAWEANVSFTMELALVKLGMDKNDEAAELLSPVLVAGERQKERYVFLANALLEMNRFKESDEHFEKAMAVNSNMYDYVRRARAYARAGDIDRAFENLNKAVEQGYTSKADIHNDDDLAPLRSNMKWQQLLPKLK